MKKASLQDVIERHRVDVMAMEGVVGIAVGFSKADPTKRCIHVYVTTTEWPKGLPHHLDGYEVELVKSPGFRAT